MRWFVSFKSWGSTLWHDGLAACVIFLLGVPLSLGAALASGAPPQSGLVAAAVGGIICGAFFGTPMMVSGPVVTVAVMLHHIITQFGFVGMCLATVAAGAVQILMGLLRMGRLTLAVNTAILEGMLASVGVGLVLSQTQVILLGRSQANTWANLVQLPHALAHARPAEAAVGAATIALVVLWDRLPWKRYVPSVLVAITVVTGALYALDVPDIARVNMPRQGAWQLLDWGQSWQQVAPHAGAWAWASVELALVCSIYSLLSAVAVDGLHNGPRTRLDRELTVQGVANVVSGALCGLPVSGAVLRSTANIKAGATTRWAITLQGGLMVLAMTLGGVLLQRLPTASLAAFFAYLGWNLLRVEQMILFWRKGTWPLYLAALVGGVATNLLIGVVAAMLVNVVLLCVSVLRLRVTVQSDPQGWQVHLDGVASFLGVATLTRALATIPQHNDVQIVNRATYTDTTITAALARYRDVYTRLGGKVKLAEGDVS